MTHINLSKNVVLVILPPEPGANDELQAVNGLVSVKCESDVIVDFARVNFLTSAGIANLILLFNWLKGAGRSLVLFNVDFAVKCIFKVAALDSLFTFAPDKAAALDLLQKTGSSASRS
jgi:anti-anti-sigma regulatory factor